MAATNISDQTQRRNECPTVNPTVVTVAARLEAKHFTEKLDVDRLVACTGDTVQWVFTNEPLVQPRRSSWRQPTSAIKLRGGTSARR